MDVLQAIKERRSVRAFRSDMPKKEDLDKIVEAGLWAANGRGAQAASVVVITNKEVRDRLSEANAAVMGADMDPFYGAPAIIVVLADKSVFTSVYDGSLVMGNMMLAAHALGLNSIWIHRAKEEFEQDEWKQFLADLGMEGDWEGVGHCAIGYADCPIPEAQPRKDGRVFHVE